MAIGGGFLLSKTYRNLTPDEAVALVDSGVNIEVGWYGRKTPPFSMNRSYQPYDLEFDWCPDLAKHLSYRVEVE